MSRWANGANATAAAQRQVGMVMLADLNFTSGSVYVHDGFGTLVSPVNSQNYEGLGQFGGVDAVVEDLTQQTAKAVALTLSGVDNSFIASAMTENYQGNLVTLYTGLLDVNSLAWYAAPEILWEGRMDYVQIDIGENRSTMKLNCESRLNREPPIARYTDQDQQLAYPGDNFFNLLWQISLGTCSWGAVNIAHPANIPPTPNKWTSPTGGAPGGPGHGPGR
jgi:hypothetical protein